MTLQQLIALRKRTDSWDQVVLSPQDFALLVDAIDKTKLFEPLSPAAFAASFRD